MWLSGGGHAWRRGACVARGGGMRGEGGCAWQRGACVAKGGVHGKRGAGEGGMHGEGGGMRDEGGHA